MANSNGEFDCRIMTLTTTSNDLKTIQGRVEKFSIPCWKESNLSVTSVRLPSFMQPRKSEETAIWKIELLPTRDLQHSNGNPINK